MYNIKAHLFFLVWITSWVLVITNIPGQDELGLVFDQNLNLRPGASQPMLQTAALVLGAALGVIIQIMFLDESVVCRSG